MGFIKYSVAEVELVKDGQNMPDWVQTAVKEEEDKKNEDEKKEEAEE